jgi:tyrosyl-tRNA synthetase
MVMDILVELHIAEIKGQARRLIEQGAVKINEEKVANWNMKLTLDPSNVYILKCGRYIYQIKPISY